MFTVNLLEDPLPSVLESARFRFLELAFLPGEGPKRKRKSIRIDDDLLCAALVVHAHLDISRGTPQPIPLVTARITIFASAWPDHPHKDVRERALRPYTGLRSTRRERMEATNSAM